MNINPAAITAFVQTSGISNEVYGDPRVIACKDLSAQHQASVIQMVALEILLQRHGPAGAGLVAASLSNQMVIQPQTLMQAPNPATLQPRAQTGYSMKTVTIVRGTTAALQPRAQTGYSMKTVAIVTATTAAATAALMNNPELMAKVTALKAPAEALLEQATERVGNIGYSLFYSAGPTGAALFEIASKRAPPVARGALFTLLTAAAHAEDFKNRLNPVRLSDAVSLVGYAGRIALLNLKSRNS